MEFIDTHTHNSDEAYEGIQDQVIERALAAGVSKLLQADTGSDERPAMYSLCEKYPGVLYPMLGLYPGNVRQNWKEEIDRMLQYKGRGAVAIGEVGLDYHYGIDFKEEQKEALRVQIDLALQMDLPLNIHLREATEDFFSIMEECARPGMRGNLHAFSGSAETFRRMQKYGEWYVGIGGVLTFRKASIANEIKDIPIERILLETDSPYLSPTPLRGSVNESANIPLIAAELARLKGLSLREVAAITTRNAKNLFRI